MGDSEPSSHPLQSEAIKPGSLHLSLHLGAVEQAGRREEDDAHYSAARSGGFNRSLFGRGGRTRSQLRRRWEHALLSSSLASHVELPLPFAQPPHARTRLSDAPTHRPRVLSALHAGSSSSSPRRGRQRAALERITLLHALPPSTCCRTHLSCPSGAVRATAAAAAAGDRARAR